MNYRYRGWKLLGLALLLGGCDGAQVRQAARMDKFVVEDGDFRLIAKASFDLIDPKGSITTIVVPHGAEHRVRIALKTVAKIIDEDQLASDGTLPAGYFRVRTFTIEDGVAYLEGQLGPVTNAVTSTGMRDCGKIYTIPIVLQGGDWVSRSYKIETCAESRNWVPMDAQTSQD